MYFGIFFVISFVYTKKNKKKLLWNFVIELDFSLFAKLQSVDLSHIIT